MRRHAVRSVALLLLFLFVTRLTPAQAQSADELRREIDGLREQLATITRSYEQRLKTLGERIEQLEANRPTPPPVSRTEPAMGTQLSLAELVAPRQPFALASPGRVLLFDLGVSGDFVADLTSAARERRRDGTFAGRENRLFPREVELGLFGRVDPYASAVVRIAAGEDASRDLTVRLDEANVSLLTLPLGTTARLGLMRPRFGTLNILHPDDLPQVDRPNALVRFFGEDELDGERGVEAFWVLPLSTYHELAVGVFDGDNEVAFGRGSLRKPLVTGRWRSFYELGDAGGLQIDLSAASGTTTDDRGNTVVGIGAKYKWIAAGIGFPVFTLAGEALAGFRRIGDETVNAGTRDVQRWGAYVYAQYDVGRRWAGGLRADWTELPTAAGHEWALAPYVQFKPSEFLRFRLEYKHTEGTGTVQRSADEMLLQGSFILGAHPTERF
jgi:hypothetical protein